MHDDFTMWAPSKQRKRDWHGDVSGKQCVRCEGAPHGQVLMQEVRSWWTRFIVMGGVLEGRVVHYGAGI